MASKSLREFIEGPLKEMFPQTQIHYQPYATHKMEKTKNGDWVDARAYKAQKIVTHHLLDYTADKPPYLEYERVTEKIDLLPEKVFNNGEVVQIISFKKGDFLLLDLGFTAKLPTNNEAYVLPRSSLFKNTGLIQTNGKGVVDNSYCGPEDIWKMPVYATQDGFLIVGERVCQWRPMERAYFKLIETNSTEESDSRQGFGSSGEL